MRSLTHSLCACAPQSGGLDPRTTLRELLLSIKRRDILTPFWDGALGLGVFRINTAFLQEHAPKKRLEEGHCPVAISTYDLFSRKTVTWSSGDTHHVVAASCAMCVRACCSPKKKYAPSSSLAPSLTAACVP